jgi:hypothetical protein
LSLSKPHFPPPVHEFWPAIPDSPIFLAKFHFSLPAERFSTKNNYKF